MKSVPRLLLAVVLVSLSGCAKKQITDHDRKEAANLVSEARFAVTIHDYARAEGLFAQATQLCPDSGGYWLNLGSMRMKLSQRDQARDAYKHALAAFQDAANKDRTQSEPALQQVYVLALLGRVDEARALQGKLVAQYPNDRDVRTFVEGNRLDQILADPQFKAFAL